MEKINRYLNLFAGLFLIGLSFNLFLLNFNLIPGGVSGLAIVISKLKGIDTSLFILIVNIILIIIGYFTLGKQFTKNTILGALLSPIFIKITSFVPNVIDIANTEKIFVAIIGGILTGYGTGLVYRKGFSCGGTDIIEFTLSKFLKIPLRTAVLLVDGSITILGGYFFGVESIIYSIVVLYFLSAMSNKMLVGINNSKTLYILSKEHNKIKKLLIEKFNTDTTILKVKGGKLNLNQNIIMAVIKNEQYEELKKDVENIDKKAFVTILKSYEVHNNNKMLKKALQMSKTV